MWNIVHNVEAIPWRLSLLLGLVTAALGATLWRIGAKKVRRWRQRQRSRVAIAGEKHAARLLQAHGYTVLDYQKPGVLRYRVGTKQCRAELRADYLVSKRGKTYVAEVKTGRLAPNPGHAPTRRQLLEYKHAYQSDGILLVDMQRGTLSEVVFELDRPDDSRRVKRLLAAGLYGLLLALILILASYASRRTSTAKRACPEPKQARVKLSSSASTASLCRTHAK